VIVRVKMPGALYRLSLKACGDKNAVLNTAICRLLGRDGWLEEIVDELAEESAETGDEYEY
jgi:hypothetical protein